MRRGRLMSDSEKRDRQRQPTTTYRTSPSGNSDRTDADGELSEVGPYQVTRTLGKGHFGRVLLAFDPRMHRHVAIKLLRAEINSSKSLKAAFAEARAQAAVHHPNVVTVHDVGKLEGGSCYIVSEYLGGGTLADRMKTGEPWTPESAIDVVIPLADALEAAHRMGLVHRDVKPANVLFNEDGRPFLGDFGLAVHETDQKAIRGQVAGTVRYMSPEQVDGRAHHLDGRTDVWALGVILYALLTGRPPFNGSSSQEVFEEILKREPRPLRVRRPDLCPDLEAIVLKCLRKRVSERYGTAGDLSSALTQWRDSQNRGNAVSAAELRGKRQFRPSHFVGVALLVTAVLGLIAALVISQRNQPDRTQPSGKSTVANGNKQANGTKKQPTIPPPSMRAAASRLFGLGGKLKLRGQRKQVGSDEELPAGPFDVQGILLYKATLNEADLESLAAFPHVESLDFRGARLQNDWLRHLSGLESLTSLSLWDTGITDDALRIVGTMKNLETLVLAETRTTDSGLKHLVLLTNLRRLILSRTRVTTEGLKLLAGFERLEHVAIDGLAIDENGLLELARVKTLRTLHTDPLSPQTRQRLQAAMPRVRITTPDGAP